MSSNDANLTSPKPEEVKTPTKSEKVYFPADDSNQRLSDYVYFEKLFLGDHYEAFNVRIQNEDYNKAYGKLRFVMANFAGLISKICADMLFSETPIIRAGEDGDQDFIDALVRKNNLSIQFYESALSNSYMGDAVFKLRVGKRHENYEKPTVIIEDITPRIYFPKLDPFNVRAEPIQTDLAWVFKKGKDSYLRKEIHEPGKITNEVYLMDGKEVGQKVDISILGIDGLQPVVDTKIDDSLVVHVANWKTGGRHFGISDYLDLDSLFFAIDNRMTKVDNILDKHSDPILMVPPGVIDEDGKVKKKALGVIEMGEGEGGKPEYIVWDASLENAFKEIEKLVEFLFMIGEVSPDALGMGKGQSDSGRALKFKLMRTIAKVARKKMYYDQAIKKVMLIAQKLAKAWNVEVDGITMKGEPQDVSIDWKDGLPTDEKEQLENETMALDAGITTKKASAQRVYGLDDESAEALLKERDEENKLAIPAMNMGGQNPFDKSGAGQNNDDKSKDAKPPMATKPPVSK